MHCLLNVPRDRTRDALRYWVAQLRSSRGRPLCFDISKDSRRLGRLGLGYSLHLSDLPRGG